MNKRKIGIILACVLGILIPVIVLTVGATNSTDLPAMTNEEQSYISFLRSNANTMDDALEEISTLMIAPQIGVDEWIFNVANQLNIMRFAHDEVSQLNPPTSMAHIHSKYMQAMNNFNDATYLLASGIDNMDVDKIEEATAKMELGAQYIEETADLLVAFTATHK